MYGEVVRLSRCAELLMMDADALMQKHAEDPQQRMDLGD